MRHNFFLDSSITGSPFHCLRALIWNIRTLGFWWWARCQAENLLIISAGLAKRVADAAPARTVAGLSAAKPDYWSGARHGVRDL